MEVTKKIFNIAIAFSVVTLSISVFIYSIRDNRAMAAAPEMTDDGYIVAGTAFYVGGDVGVVGYNPKTKDTKLIGFKKRAFRDYQ